MTTLHELTQKVDARLGRSDWEFVWRTFPWNPQLGHIFLRRMPEVGGSAEARNILLGVLGPEVIAEGVLLDGRLAPLPGELPETLRPLADLWDRCVRSTAWWAHAGEDARRQYQAQRLSEFEQLRHLLGQLARIEVDRD